LLILVPSVIIMTNAVINVTPDFVSEMVPGSASLYDTKICETPSDQ
jgi:hypothetical protein